MEINIVSHNIISRSNIHPKIYCDSWDGEYWGLSEQTVSKIKFPQRKFDTYSRSVCSEPNIYSVSQVYIPQINI